MYPFDYAAWSVAFELCINVVYAGMFCYFYSKRIKTLLVLSGALMVFCIILQDHIDLGVSLEEELPIGMMRTTFSFFLGVFIYRSGKIRSRSSHFPLLPLTCIFALALVQNCSGQLEKILNIFAVFLLFPTVIACASQFSILSRAARPTCANLGVSSYAIYSIHLPTFMFALATLPRSCERDIQDHAPFSQGIFIAILRALSILLDRYYDMPIRRSLVRVLPSLKPATAK